MNSILHSVIFHILRPLVKILHRKGISFAEFSQIARQVYVETAEASLLAAGEKATTSRIAITTGLTRKDVAVLRKAEAVNEPLTVRYNRGVRVISGWLSDADFQDEAGNPAPLPLQGTTASFERLVSRYSGDMPYQTMLKELEQSQLVEVTAKGLSLLDAAYIPQGDEAEKLTIMGRDVGLLLGTIDHNLQPAPASLPHFQRKVAYSNLPYEAVESFKAMVQQDGMALLVKFNEWLARHDRDANPAVTGSGTVYAGVGIYYFEESAVPAAHPNHKDFVSVS
ncbi:MAG: DUF6502 family protein [Thiolinea sp.]